MCAPPVEARVARKLFPDVRLLEREPAKDRILDDLSRKRGRNSEEDSEAITSKKRECGEPMETETEEATTAVASAPMESDESIVDELVHALVEEVAPAKMEDESDAELDFDDTWSMQGMWSSRSDVYSPAMTQMMSVPAKKIWLPWRSQQSRYWMRFATNFTRGVRTIVQRTLRHAVLRET